MITPRFPLDCWNVYHYFDIVICFNSNILNQFFGSENFETLRQQMESHGSNVGPGFPISGNSR